jgi:hypothetical protein
MQLLRNETVARRSGIRLQGIDSHKSNRGTHLRGLLQNARSRDVDGVVAQWDSTVQVYNDSTSRYEYLLADMHILGGMQGEIHFWSGMWDSQRWNTHAPTQDPIIEAMHEVGHRYYYRLGDLQANHTDIQGHITQCCSREPL